VFYLFDLLIKAYIAVVKWAVGDKLAKFRKGSRCRDCIRYIRLFCGPWVLCLRRELPGLCEGGWQTRFSFLLVLASAGLMAECVLGKAQTPEVHRGNSAAERDLGKQTAPEILAKNRKVIAVILAADSESARLGTGFFVGASGLLLTNFHVVEGAAAVGIRLPEAGRVLVAAKARGYDLDNDLVVLQVDGANAQCVRLGDSDRVYSGQPSWSSVTLRG